MKRRQSVRLFKKRVPAERAALTFGGTGLNGAVQFWVLNELGQKYIRDAHQLNLVSGSVFSYILYIALCEDQRIDQDYLIDFDRLNRRFHKASFLQSCKHIVSGKVIKTGLYPNHYLGGAITGIFDQKFLDRKLSEMPKNVCFYSYCSLRDSIVDITPGTIFDDMNIMDILRACASVVPLHGHFCYEGYHFCDPMFSPQCKNLFQRLFSTQLDHLVVNYKKEGKSDNIYFVKHDQNHFPKFVLLRDFLMLYLNIPNKALNKTHIQALHEFHGTNSV